MSPTIQSNINTIQFCSTYIFPSLLCAIHINDQISSTQKCTKEDSNRSNEIIHKKRKKKQKPTEANYSFQNLILKQENHSALLPVLPILKNLTTILGISYIIC